MVPTVPISEIFGPTLQGEGPHIGAPCVFVRVFGCDYRCAWCDSMHAVKGTEFTKLTPGHILARVVELSPSLPVVITGGNPGLYGHLGYVVDRLQPRKVWVETQGSHSQPWMGDVDTLVISPKPPSAQLPAVSWGELVRRNDALHECLTWSRKPVFKVVVFDETDIRWALELKGAYPWVPLYLSCGTVGGESRDSLLFRYRNLISYVNASPDGGKVTSFLPQLHVLTWGHDRGV